MNWQPIETAPKDGTLVLLYGRCQWESYGLDTLPRVVVGHYSDPDSSWTAKLLAKGYHPWELESSNPYSDNCAATHWMPLLEPPVEGEEE